MYLRKEMMSEDLHWYVANVRSYTEKKTAATLLKMGIKTFFPVRKRVVIDGHTTHVARMVVSPGILYIRATEQQRKELFQLFPGIKFQGVAAGKPLIVPDDEMDEMIRTFELGNEV
jgi:hypothetical protein